MRMEYDGQTFEVRLIDDGTLDTVISVDGIEHRFDAEYASSWRFSDGAMSVKDLIELAKQAIDDDERHWK